MSTTDLRNLLEDGCLVKLANGKVYPVIEGRILRLGLLPLHKNLYDQYLVPADASEKQTEELRIDVISNYIRDLDLIPPAQWPAILNRPENLKWVRLVTELSSKPKAKTPAEYLENGCLVMYDDGDIGMLVGDTIVGQKVFSSICDFDPDLKTTSSISIVAVTRPATYADAVIEDWPKFFNNLANIVWQRPPEPKSKLVLEHGGFYFIRFKDVEDTAYLMARYNKDTNCFKPHGYVSEVPAKRFIVDEITGQILRKTENE